jgi:hypothetical protein
MEKTMNALIGETIASVEVVEYDQIGDEQRVDEMYRVTTASGKVIHLMIDGGDCGHYGTMRAVDIGEDGHPRTGYGPGLGRYVGEFKKMRKVALPSRSLKSPAV